MPTVLKRNISPDTVLAIWKMDEPMDWLLQRGILIPEEIQNNKRKREWVCSRLLLAEIAPNTSISYNQFGAPLLSDRRAISISHSKDYCGILISKHKASLDIERINEKAFHLRNQFIAADEKVFLQPTSQASLIWSAKECLFKLHQEGKLIFKKDLKVLKISQQQAITTLKGKEYQLEYENFHGYFLVYYYE